jgi:hypothetical protein
MATLKKREFKLLKQVSIKKDLFYSSPQAVELDLGFMLLIISALGLTNPSFLGLKLNIVHCLVLGASGVLSIWGGLTPSSSTSFRINLFLGVFFILNALIGYLVGNPGMAQYQFYSEEQLNRLAPGFLELAITDHLVHLILGVFFFMEAFFWRYHFVVHKKFNPKIRTFAIRSVFLLVLVAAVLTVVKQMRGFP